MIGHTVVWPAREVKLSDLPDLMSPSLRNRVIKLNTQSTAGDGREVVRRQRIQCTDDVRGPSRANRVGLNTNTLHGQSLGGVEQSFHYLTANNMFKAAGQGHASCAKHLV